MDNFQHKPVSWSRVHSFSFKWEETPVKVYPDIS